MKTLLIALTTFLSPYAFAAEYTAKDCEEYVKKMKFPAAYCQVNKSGEPEQSLEQWLESLRKIPGPIQALEKKILAELGCEPEGSCGIGDVSDNARIMINQGNDSNGGGSRVRYFLYYSEHKSEQAVLTIDVSQDVEVEHDSAIRRIGKVLPFRE